MPTSGSTDFTMTANQIVEKAFKRIGVASEGEAMTARMYYDGMETLNLLVKSWGTYDHLWTRTGATVTLINGQAAYTLSPKPLRVLEVRRRITVGSIDTPLTELSQSQYLEQSNKTISSVPNSFYYDPSRATGTLYIWPPASAQTAAQQTLQYTYRRVIQDFDASNDEADFPQEWLQALIWCLADELMAEYPVNDDSLASRVAGKAAYWKAELEAFDTEPASLFLEPDYRWC